MSVWRLEELDDFLLIDAGFVQPEQTARARQSRDDRDVSPVEVDLDHRRLPLGHPSAPPCRALADVRFVHKDDQ